MLIDKKKQRTLSIGEETENNLIFRLSAIMKKLVISMIKNYIRF